MLRRRRQAGTGIAFIHRSVEAVIARIRRVRGLIGRRANRSTMIDLLPRRDLLGIERTGQPRRQSRIRSTARRPVKPLVDAAVIVYVVLCPAIIRWPWKAPR